MHARATWSVSHQPDHLQTQSTQDYKGHIFAIGIVTYLGQTPRCADQLYCHPIPHHAVVAQLGKYFYMEFKPRR